MDWIFLTFALILAVLFGLAGLFLGEIRGGRPVAGFWLGFLLGPVGVILAGLGDRQCPACRSWIDPRASRCPRCHESVSPVATTGSTPAAISAETIGEAQTHAHELRNTR